MEHVLARTVPLNHDPIPPQNRLEGAPSAGILEQGEFEGHGYGLWELTPGVVTDTETTELFVVLSGSATIEFVDSGESITVGPGDLVRLDDGARTVWRVTETLRKVYISGSTTV